MSTNNSTQHVQIAVADPTPLGLFGLAIVTMVASAQKLGLVEGVSWVIPWALVCGSFAQLLAAYFDFCHKNNHCQANNQENKTYHQILCCRGISFLVFVFAGFNKIISMTNGLHH